MRQRRAIGFIYLIGLEGFRRRPTMLSGKADRAWSTLGLRQSGKSEQLRSAKFLILTTRAGLRVPTTKGWRPEPESNRRARICSPLRHHSAIGPSGQLVLRDAPLNEQARRRNGIRNTFPTVGRRIRSGAHFGDPEGRFATRHPPLAKRRTWPHGNARRPAIVLAGWRKRTPSRRCPMTPLAAAPAPAATASGWAGTRRHRHRPLIATTLIRNGGSLSQ